MTPAGGSGGGGARVCQRGTQACYCVQQEAQLLSLATSYYWPPDPLGCPADWGGHPSPPLLLLFLMLVWGQDGKIYFFVFFVFVPVPILMISLPSSSIPCVNIVTEIRRDSLNETREIITVSV